MCLSWSFFAYTCVCARLGLGSKGREEDLANRLDLGWTLCHDTLTCVTWELGKGGATLHTDLDRLSVCWWVDACMRALDFKNRLGLLGASTLFSRVLRLVGPFPARVEEFLFVLSEQDMDLACLTRKNCVQSKCLILTWICYSYMLYCGVEQAFVSRRKCAHI